MIGPSHRLNGYFATVVRYRRPSLMRRVWSRVWPWLAALAVVGVGGGFWR